MNKNGVYFLKALPPHRGHLNCIINAATQCEHLYVVVSSHVEQDKELCENGNVKYIPINLRLQWLSQELLDLPHIKVIALDEAGLPRYPHGWVEWANRLSQVLDAAGCHTTNVFFVGEEDYTIELPKYFPNAAVDLFDVGRSEFSISGTEIRNFPIKHWDYILGSARYYFAKKILIVGTESCGKTTLTKYLAKRYHTSWSEEVGRYYAAKYLGGNESIFTDEDFNRLAYLQYESDLEALHHANKMCFFDTDAVVTQYYSELYMGHSNSFIDNFANKLEYDLIIFLTPDVEWVSDGQRLNGDQAKREELDAKLEQMYIDRGMNVVRVSGDYNGRLRTSIELIDNLMKEVE